MRRKEEKEEGESTGKKEAEQQEHSIIVRMTGGRTGKNRLEVDEVEESQRKKEQEGREIPL